MAAGGPEAAAMNAGMGTPADPAPAAEAAYRRAAIATAAIEDACPYLGLIEDPASRCTFVAAAHRCHRPEPARRIPFDVQRSLCLSAEYGACPVYRGEAEGFGAAPRRRRSVRVVTVAPVALIVLFVLGAIAIAGYADDRSTAAGSSATPRPTVQTSEQATPPPTPPSNGPAVPSLPEQTLLAPALSPIPAPAPPEATPAPPPTPPATHVVQPGDSISEIAARYGLNAVALSELNGIPWNATIYPGEVLRLR
jgi:LysM repeat protein